MPARHERESLAIGLKQPGCGDCLDQHWRKRRRLPRVPGLPVDAERGQYLARVAAEQADGRHLARFVSYRNMASGVGVQGLDQSSTRALIAYHEHSVRRFAAPPGAGAGDQAAGGHACARESGHQRGKLSLRRLEREHTEIRALDESDPSDADGELGGR